MTQRHALILLIIGLLFSCKGPKHKDDLNEAPNLQTDSLNISGNQTDTFARVNVPPKNESNYWFSDADKADLKHRGIPDPEKNLIESLDSNIALIPYPGVLGGRMHFGKITLLGNRWAVADFDDGHIIGRMLLKYTIQKDSSIMWKVIDHYLE